MNASLTNLKTNQLDCLQSPVERPHLLAEYLPQHPYFTLQEIFAPFSACQTLKEFLNQWLDGSVTESDIPQALREFYQSLLLLIEAMHDLNEQHNSSRSPAETTQQTALKFCESYPLVFVRRELWCFVNAAVLCAVDHPVQFLPDAALDWYEKVSALVESAYILCEEIKVR